MNTPKQIKKAFKKMDIKLNPVKGKEVCRSIQAVRGITKSNMEQRISDAKTKELLKFYIPGLKEISDYEKWIQEALPLCVIHMDSIGLPFEERKKYFESLKGSNFKKAKSAPKLIKSSPRQSVVDTPRISIKRLSVTNTPRQSLGNPSRRSSVGSIKNEPTIFN